MVSEPPFLKCSFLVKVAFHKESSAIDHIRSTMVVEVLDYILATGGVSQVDTVEQEILSIIKFGSKRGIFNLAMFTSGDLVMYNTFSACTRN